MSSSAALPMPPPPPARSDLTEGDLVMIRRIRMTPDSCSELPVDPAFNYNALIKRMASTIVMLSRPHTLSGLDRGTTIHPDVKTAFPIQSVPTPHPSTPAIAARVQKMAEVISGQQQVIDRHRDWMTRADKALRAIHAAAVCPVCKGLTILPRILGDCGHVVCHTCADTMGDYVFESLSEEAIARQQHVLRNRCPLCRKTVVAGGLPVYPLRDVVRALIDNRLVSIRGSALQAIAEKKLEDYPKLSYDDNHLSILQVNCMFHVRIAEFAAAHLLAGISSRRWKDGVMIDFDGTASRVFLETFATKLVDTGGLLVMISPKVTAMIAIRLQNRFGKRIHGPPRLVRIGPGGRFYLPKATDTVPPVHPLSARPAAMGTEAPPPRSTL